MKTSKKQYRLFEKEVVKFQSAFGLQGWQIRSAHIKLDDHCFAGVQYNMGNKWAEVRFNTDLDSDHPLTDEAITRTAMHEVLHLLLAELYTLAECRNATAAEIDRAEHTVIRTLENYILGAPK